MKSTECISFHDCGVRLDTKQQFIIYRNKPQCVFMGNIQGLKEEVISFLYVFLSTLNLDQAGRT